MCEAAICAILGTLAFQLPAWREHLVPGAVTFFLLFIMHGLIVPFRGLDFGFNDEPTDPRIGTYSAVALLLALMGGMILKDWVIQVLWN